MNSNLDRQSQNHLHSNQPETLSWIEDKRDEAQVIENVLRARRMQTVVDDTYEAPELPKSLRAFAWATIFLTMTAVISMYMTESVVEPVKNPPPVFDTVKDLRDSVAEVAPPPKAPVPPKRKDRPELRTAGLLDPKIRAQLNQIIQQADEIIAISNRASGRAFKME